MGNGFAVFGKRTIGELVLVNALNDLVVGGADKVGAGAGLQVDALHLPVARPLLRVLLLRQQVHGMGLARLPVQHLPPQLCGRHETAASGVASHSAGVRGGAGHGARRMRGMGRGAPWSRAQLSRLCRSFASKRLRCSDSLKVPSK